jgi:hypothetical protein
MNQPQSEQTKENPNIVSSFGIRGNSSQFARISLVLTQSHFHVNTADECDRLWVVDSGMTDLLGKPTKIQSPSVFIFNLNTNQLIRHFEIPANQMKPESFFVNVVSC